MSATENRPVFLNLLRIRQPVTAVLSILHRISGIVMILSLPGLVYLLNLSLSNQAGFLQVAGLLGSPEIKILAAVFCWAVTHHILAGIRFMLLDFEVGVERSAARKSAWLVHAVTLIITIFVAGLMFGAAGGLST